MNAYLLCLIAAVAADDRPLVTSAVYQPARQPVTVVSAYRPIQVSTRYINIAQQGQPLQGEPQPPQFTPETLPQQSPPGTVPEYEYLNSPGTQLLAPGEQSIPLNQTGPSLWDPRQDPGVTYDPFMGTPDGCNVCQPCQPQGTYQQYGVNGPVPYRMGWTHRASVTYISSESTGVGGEMEIFGVDASLQRASMVGPDWIFTHTPTFGMRTWEGPTGVGLPGSVFHFAWDLELAVPVSYSLPWTLKFGFTPSLNTDFESSPGSDAVLFDGRVILHHQIDREWGLILGAEYWDRVEDRVIPHVGVTWMPNPLWDFRLAFPESRVSYFLGQDVAGHPIWIYARGEYHVEAYEIELQPVGVTDQIELEDWRLLFGLRKEAGPVAGFLEVGWVFGREVNFKNVGPDFDINSGFIARLGLRY